MKKKYLFLLLLSALIFPVFGFAASEQICFIVNNIKVLIYQVGGTLVVVGWVIAGILYLTSMGGERMGVAKKAMIAALIGTLLVVLSGGMYSVITNAIGWIAGGQTMCP